MTDVDDSLTAMDWLLNPSIDLLAVFKLNCFIFDHIPQSDKLDYHPESSKAVEKNASPCEKPPFSYAELIKRAIEASPQRKMTLNEIYQWICEHFPYYRDGHSGWKIARRSDEPGRGSFWRVVGERQKIRSPPFVKPKSPPIKKALKHISTTVHLPTLVDPVNINLPAHSLPSSDGPPMDFNSRFKDNFSAHFAEDPVGQQNAIEDQSFFRSDAQQPPRSPSFFNQITDTFRRLSEDIYLPDSFSHQYKMGLENSGLNERLQKNLWLASLADWSEVRDPDVQNIFELLGVIERYIVQPPLADLFELNNQLELIFRNNSQLMKKIPVTFDSANSSPRALPAIQDSFGPHNECTTRRATSDLLGQSHSKDGVSHNETPTSWVQSILAQEDDQGKMESSAAYSNALNTSYFEPITLDQTPHLPHINDIQRQAEVRPKAKPSIFVGGVSPLTTVDYPRWTVSPSQDQRRPEWS